MWGEDTGIFVSAVQDAQVGVFAQLLLSRHAGECPLCGAPTTIDTGASRTEPPLCVTDLDARMPSTHDICHVQVMTLCTAAARKPAV